jgi:DMSO/TMAO reductase YedYZ heme-binding membrane subunit
MSLVSLVYVGLAHYLLKVKIIPVELILYASVLVILLLFRLVWFLIKRTTERFTLPLKMESG